jgi:c-di-AMP phosphodiesterase-like protein
LVNQTDKIDSADLSIDEVQHPENHPYLLLSMTINGRDSSEKRYWNALVGYLQRYDIEQVMRLPEVHQRCQQILSLNQRFKEILIAYTSVQKHVAVSDFRPVSDLPDGNRFLVYSLFPETSVSVKIRYWDDTRTKLSIGVGHSIFNRTCRVNVGQMLTQFEGGGHHGAGGCSFDANKADQYIKGILEILLKNEPLT